VRQLFGELGAVNKYRMACVIADRFPELASRLPPERKPWMAEDARMGIFDAASFALTVLRLENASPASIWLLNGVPPENH
jgi:hypothetical protein